jgi:hypothetical protein
MVLFILDKYKILVVMKIGIYKEFNWTFSFISIVLLIGCSSSGNRNSNNMKHTVTKGKYGYDVAFFTKKGIKTIELEDAKTKARVLLVPGYQGRVMTSTAGGNEGVSFGWINYKIIESGNVNNQFNPYGGEERIWIGPEGGPFSIYFKKGTEQVFSNWVVPKEIDTEPFDVVSQFSDKVSFRRDFELTNASGTKLDIRIERTIKLMTVAEAEGALEMPIDNSLSFVAYESENILINKGQSDWTEQSGALSVWMLAMFNPSGKGVVFIPFKNGSESESGKIVTDDYFGKVPSDRLIIKDGILFFKTDGKLRSKIGISPQRALPFCGSYDPEKQVLTLLWYSSPDKPSRYVNSKWGDQTAPFSGDVVNAYNDGPVADGSIMGPFYEIESSSPAAFLSAGSRITHTQRIFHIIGNEEKLSLITEKLFHYSISEIKVAFKSDTNRNAK